MTRTDLDQLVIVINNLTRGNYYVQGAYGRVRLVRDGGSVEVSPPLSRPELGRWMHAFIDGIIVGQVTQTAQTPLL